MNTTQYMTKDGMYQYKDAVHDAKLAYWQSQPSDNPNMLNGFHGPFQITDLSKIPDDLMPYLVERFRLWDTSRKSTTKKLTPEKVNEALNEVWGGPGSMVNVIEATNILRKERELAEQIAADAE